MDTREAIGVIAVSLVPFLVSVGAVLSVGAPEMAISYRRFFASSQLTGPKGVRLSAVVYLLIIAWVFAGIALRARGDRSFRSSSPETHAHDAEVAFNPPDDEASPRGGRSGDGQAA